MTQSPERSFQVTRMFHPSHHVTDLDEAEAFFLRVFGRESVSLSSLSKGGSAQSGTRTDYSIFTLIADVLFDSIDPSKNVVQGKQIYSTAQKAHLRGFGWYVDGITEAFRALQEAGVALVNQLGEPVVGDEPPLAGGQVPMFFTVPDSVGQRYQLTVTIPTPLDPRIEPGWSVAADPADPLGIERAAWHTMLTADPERALAFIGALGGRVVHEGRNEMIGARSTFVHLADGIIEYAVPDEGTFAHEDWTERAPLDTYHAITWQVRDLDRVARHLESQGVVIASRSEDSLVTDPDTSLGVPWGFTTAPVPGDPRATQD